MGLFNRALSWLKTLRGQSTLRITGEWIFYYDDGTILVRKNLITQAGLNYLAGMLSGENPSTDLPVHLALGTGTTAAASADVKLVNEGMRKAISSKSRQDGLVRLRAFLANNEANGNWQEYGIFLAGTSNKDSGVLLNRLVTPISKSNNQVLTIEVRIAFSA